MSRSAGVTELSESLCLDLTDTLTGDVKLLAYFLKSSCATVVKSETELDDVLFSGGKGVKLALDDLTQNCRCRRIRRSGGLLVGNGLWVSMPTSILRIFVTAASKYSCTIRTSL